ncbi:homologous-pairing protein 2 homolog [Asterias rubens]|uniref:homologous-pairing protein 2 homolog n=1 Tax=Asterias rubens TaxID=7604 RepID=UPI00145584F7|nr:homologous-pairing protein 2 homolog [Asterias rubens]XP_033639242.1 homologous-pairing protein 2 homolog [Asterias rubens]
MSKSKDGDVGVAIEDYLNRANRPYSAIDVFNNLHKEFGKTAVVRALEDLAENGKIKEKIYGKQKVYFADQSQFPAVDESELKSMDAEINDLTGKLQMSQSTCKQQENELRKIDSSMSTEDAKQRLEQVNQEIEHNKERLTTIKSMTNHVTPQEKERIYANQTKYVKEWKKRKRMTMDIVNAILEGYPKTKKQLFEDVGLETDEEYNVTVPS